MDELLTPKSTSYTNKETVADGRQRPVQKPPLRYVSTPEEALEVLKNEPEHDILISTLNFLNNATKSFDIRSPRPLASQILHVLVSEVIPLYWPVWVETQHDLRSLQTTRASRSTDLDILLSCIKSVSGLSAILLKVRQHIQYAKAPKKEVSGSNNLVNLTIYLQVLEVLLESHDTIQNIWSMTNTIPTSNTQSRALWTEFLALIGGKILGLTAEAEVILRAEAKNSSSKYWITEAKVYSIWIAENVSQWARTILIDQETQWKACSEILSKSFRLGHTEIIVKTLLDSLLLQTDQTPIQILKLIGSLPYFEQRTFVSSVLRVLTTDHLSIEVTTEADSNWWKSDEAVVAASARLINLLVANDDSRIAHLVIWLTAASGAGLGDGIAIRRAVVAAIAEYNTILEDVVEKSLQQFADQLYIKHVPSMQQEVHAQVLLLAAGQLHRKWPLRFSMILRAGKHLQLVSNRLGASSLRARFLGMVIAESLSSLVDQGDKRMDFKMDELSTPEALWYKSLVNVTDTVGTLTTLQLNNKAQIPVRPAFKPTKPIAKAKPKATPPQGTKILAIEEVSDDEDADADSDDDGLAPYAKPDSDLEDSDEDPTLITRNKPSAPVYIRTLMTYLRSTENYDHQKLGLLHAASLIRRKANFGTELTSHAEEVASLLVGIQDKFEIEDFDNLRLQGMIALVVAQPQKMAPWFAKTFFDGDYSISQRASILTTLGLSARELGGFGSESNSSMTAEAFPSKTLPESTHKRFTPLSASATSTLKPISSLTAHLQTAFLAPLATSLADQALGPDVLKLRTVSSRYKATTKPAPKRTITNTLATTVSSSFFFPLTGRFFLHLKSFGSTAARNVLFQPYLLAHFLRTLAILLHASGPSTLALPQMTIEFWDLLLSLRAHAAGDVSILEALLFALLTILEINEDKRSLVDENGGRIVETQGWVEGVFQKLGSAEGEEEVKLRMLAAGVLVRIGEVVEKYQALLVGDLIRLEG